MVDSTSWCEGKGLGGPKFLAILRYEALRDLIAVAKSERTKWKPGPMVPHMDRIWQLNLGLDIGLILSGSKSSKTPNFDISHNSVLQKPLRDEGGII